MAKFIAAFSPWFFDGVEFELITVNGRPGAVMRRGGTLIGAVTLDVSDAGIEQVLWMMNPGKLAAVTRPARRPR